MILMVMMAMKLIVMFSLQDDENDAPFYDHPNAVGLREGCGNSKWKFKMAFAIRRPTPAPPLNGTNFQTFFTPLFLLQLNPTYMKRILHFKNITFKSSYNWFKIDIHQHLRPLTANYLAMFKVISTTIYT